MKMTYLEELNQRIASEQLLDHPALPKFNISPEDPTVAVILNKMRQRTEMEQFVEGHRAALPALVATVEQLQSRVSEAERLIAEAKADLLAGKQPDPHAALQSLIIDDLREQLAAAVEERTKAEREESRVANELSTFDVRLGYDILNYANDVRVARAYALQDALLAELVALADADGGRGQFGRRFTVSTKLAAIANSQGFIEILRTRRGMAK
ncbi:hypothetical protein R4036_004576 [Salmonella enterica]|nr:hypothetical protein [Salmonella enterica]